MKDPVIEWLDPWTSTDGMDKSCHQGFFKQLCIELPLGHDLHGLPAKLIGRGNGDDALFAILDGSNRVAVVHLTWVNHAERLPFPLTTIYDDLDHFAAVRMRPEHADWIEWRAIPTVA